MIKLIQEHKTVTISLLISGMFIAGYLFSSTYMDEDNEVIVNDPVTTVNHEVIMEQKVDRKKPELVVKKEQVDEPAVKLKPHHLYVRNNEQIEKDISIRKESRERYLKIKKSREDHMRQQRLQQHINQRKGKEDV